MGILVPVDNIKEPSNEACPDASSRLVDEATRTTQPSDGNRDCGGKADERVQQPAPNGNLTADNSEEPDSLREEVKITLEILKELSKGLASDVVAGTAGLAVKTYFGRNPLALGLGVLTGGVTKYGATHALDTHDKSFTRAMLWGGIDVLAFAAGAGVQKKLVANLEEKYSTEVLCKLGLKHLTQAENVALARTEAMREILSRIPTVLPDELPEWRFYDALAFTQANRGRLSTVLAPSLNQEEKAALQRMLNLNGTESEALLLDEAAARLKVHLDITQAHKKSFQTQLETTIGNKKGLEGIKAVISAVDDNVWYSATYRHLNLPHVERGRLASFLNPFNGIDYIENYTTVSNLQSKLFWRQYGVNAASIGTTSLVWRGSHEAALVGEKDPVTGESYSAYDAAINTGLNVACDAVVGPMLVANFKSTAADIFTIRSPAYRKVGDAFAKLHSKVNTNSSVAEAVRSIATSLGLASPRLLHLGVYMQDASKYADWLAATK